MHVSFHACAISLSALLLVASCGGATLAPTPPKTAAPTLDYKATPGKRSFCTPATGDQFAVGLRPGHGWQRGAWVLLSVDKPGLSVGYPAAIAVVVEGWADVAKVHVLFQRPDESKLDGAQVRVIGRDERARLNQYVGKIATIQTGRAKIDLGSFDGVHKGDEYEIRAGVESNRSVGRLRIVLVGTIRM